MARQKSQRTYGVSDVENTCPRCKGKKWIGPVHINRGDQPHEWRERVDCDLCKAAGRITEDQREAIELGKRLRQKRVDREESLMEGAKRLGLKPSELSGLETGRGGMTAWRHPWAQRAYLEATHS